MGGIGGDLGGVGTLGGTTGVVAAVVLPPPWPTNPELLNIDESPLIDTPPALLDDPPPPKLLPKEFTALDPPTLLFDSIPPKEDEPPTDERPADDMEVEGVHASSLGAIFNSSSVG